MINKSIIVPFVFLLNTLLCLNCADKTIAPTGIELTLIESIPINIKEPSGLTFNNDKTKFWIVGDNEPKIYLTDLRGSIEKEYKVSKNDLEGITSIGDSILAVVVEITREILFLNLHDNTERIIQTGLQGDANNGLEGIAYFPLEKNLFLANEKNPKLILKINFDATILSNNSIDFGKDIADLFYDESENILWVLSQESNIIFKCNTGLQIIEQYSIPDKKYEGISVDKKNIYLVSDSDQLLSIYKIP